VLDLTAIEGFQWDAGNARKNEKHGVSQQEAEQIFLNTPLLILMDEKHVGAEPRFHALGITLAARQLHITFTIRDAGRLIRIISARPMHRKERMIYAQKAETDS